MEENRYPILDEGQSIDMACEPIAGIASPTTRSVNGITEVHDWIDDLDWNRLPILGPKSVEEAIARIKEAENDLNDPGKWTSAEDFDKELLEEFPWLR